MDVQVIGSVNLFQNSICIGVIKEEIMRLWPVNQVSKLHMYRCNEIVSEDGYMYSSSPVSKLHMYRCNLRVLSRYQKTYSYHVSKLHMYRCNSDDEVAYIESALMFQNSICIGVIKLAIVKSMMKCCFKTPYVSV